MGYREINCDDLGSVSFAVTDDICGNHRIHNISRQRGRLRFGGNAIGRGRFRRLIAFSRLQPYRFARYLGECRFVRARHRLNVNFGNNPDVFSLNNRRSDFGHHRLHHRNDRFLVARAQRFSRADQRRCIRGSTFASLKMMNPLDKDTMRLIDQRNQRRRNLKLFAQPEVQGLLDRPGSLSGILKSDHSPTPLQGMERTTDRRQIFNVMRLINQ